MPKPIENMNLSVASNVLLVCYFGGSLFTSGVLGLVAPSELGTLVGGIFGWSAAIVYSWAIILVGLSGLAAMAANSRKAEFYAILGAAAMTILNGLVLLPEHPQTAMRLLFAPAMIVPFGWMRMGFTISPVQVGEITREIAAERETQGNGGRYDI